jgi:hypothetical protein
MGALEKTTENLGEKQQRSTDHADILGLSWDYNGIVMD